MILCLAHSKPEDVNSAVSQLDKRTSLHIAASQSNLVILQLLIWYGEDVDATDNQGRNALAYARNSNASECIQILIHNGCKDLPANAATPILSNASSTTTSILNLNNANTLTRKSNASISTSHIGVVGNHNTNGQSYDKITYNII